MIAAGRRHFPRRDKRFRALIIDRYLIREVATASVAVSIVLFAIFFTYSLTRFLSDAASGFLRAAEVAQLTLLKSVIALEVLLPIGLYFGVILGLGRLNGHQEITALRSCGVSRWRINRPIIFFSLALAVIVGGFSTLARPWAYTGIYTLETNAAAASELDRIKPGGFYLIDGGKRTVFVKHVDAVDGSLRDIFVRTRKGADLEIITALAGRLEPYVTTDRHRLLLEGVQLFKEVESGTDFVGSFGRLSLFLKARVPKSFAHKPKAKPTSLLGRSRNGKDMAEFQWRLSTPVSTLLLTMLALQLVQSRPRETRFARLPLALAIYALYYNLLGVGRSWVEQEKMSSFWWVPGLLLIVLIALWMAGRRRER